MLIEGLERGLDARSERAPVGNLSGSGRFHGQEVVVRGPKDRCLRRAHRLLGAAYGSPRGLGDRTSGGLAHTDRRLLFVLRRLRDHGLALARAARGPWQSAALLVPVPVVYGGRVLQQLSAVDRRRRRDANVRLVAVGRIQDQLCCCGAHGPFHGAGSAALVRLVRIAARCAQ